jgi:hypothetical protein
MGSFGDVGADEGAWMAIEGIEIDAGGAALILSERSGSGDSYTGSVCVEMETTSTMNVGEGGCTNGVRIVGVAGGLKGWPIVCMELEIIEDVVRVILGGGLGDPRGTDTRFRR